MKYVLAIIGVFVLLSTILWFNYTQIYNQDSVSTATSGIVFQKTLYLKAYKHVSTGNDLWGTYDRYSRSDRHNETITVYCRSYCKE